MEQFSHDLSLALEETSRISRGRWTARRRTRSTGNLPCAPQPTEDSSSSPEDAANPYHPADPSSVRIGAHGLSDSDNGNAATATSHFPLSAVRADVSLANVESDSLNETFSPARPCARRKRRFKRMAVEYETSHADRVAGSSFSGPGIGHRDRGASFGGTSTGGGSLAHHRMIPRYGGSCQESYRANLFCGKRKRSHRDRYDYDHHRPGTHSHHHHHHNHHSHHHSSSVPRQREMFSSSSLVVANQLAARNKSGEFPGNSKIQPLNQNIISRIAKIAQDSHCPSRGTRPECEFKPIDPVGDPGQPLEEEEEEENTLVAAELQETRGNITIPGMVVLPGTSVKSGSLESNFSFQEYGSCSGNSGTLLPGGSSVPSAAPGATANVNTTAPERSAKRHHARRHHRHKRSAMRMQLQFDDPSFMDCPMADVLSSSSLSSSDSDTDKSCDSDREGDDELTDWPGNNEGSLNVAGLGDFRRTKSQKMSQKGGGLPLIKSDEDTRMSAEDMRMQAAVVLPLKPGFVPVTVPLPSAATPPGFLNRGMPSMPIDMPMGMGGGGVGFGGGGGGIGPHIESELSGETSNHFLSSPNTLNDVREFRAGCRRVREERPSFSVITSINEDLSRFLQDGRQTQLQLPDSDALEHEKLMNLAKLYSLDMRLVDGGIAILTKTSNTTQPVRVDRSNMSKRYLSDFKRRCYEEPATGSAPGGASSGATSLMTSIEHEMNDIQS